MKLTDEAVREVLGLFGIADYDRAACIDSSHGEGDIRCNYIIDRQYVLRVNSAHIMTDARLAELNALVARYRDFGLEAPLFLQTADGRFTVEREGMLCYLSEYLDRPLADEVKHRCREQLIEERAVLVARFAQRFKNVDLVDTRSMYSLFDLSPYDQLTGVEEKQENLEQLTAELTAAGEVELADRLTRCNEDIRRQLRAVHWTLPRCVFQGDENFSNLCVDGQDHIVGLFDFNMSGTEVIANYLANIAFQGNFFFTDEIMETRTAEEIYQMVMDAYRRNTELICQHYRFTGEELTAYRLYSGIVLLSGYCNVQAYCAYLKEEATRDKVTALLRLICGGNSLWNCPQI